MWALLVPIISSLLGEKGPIGQYFKIKSDQVAAKEKLDLAELHYQTTQLETDARQVSDRLNSTSQNFKQSTFWFIAFPVVITMLPFTSVFAVTMWQNFTLIPDWFQILFVSVYSSIWGLPIAKEYLGGMFKSLGNGLAASREYRLEKKKINRDAAFASVKSKWFPKGMSQRNVDEFNEVLDAGESVENN